MMGTRKKESLNLKVSAKTKTEFEEGAQHAGLTHEEFLEMLMTFYAIDILLKLEGRELQ